MPTSLTAWAWLSLGVAVLCALWIALDIARGYRQHMTIMNVVWPITALYAGPLAVWGYVRVGRKRSDRWQREARERGESTDEQPSLARSVALAATHCGSGCSLADLIVESSLIALPLSLFGSEVAAAWTLDFVLAFLIGIAFQYFSIRPMSDKPPLHVLGAAIKADTLSLASWQVGMYGWMALVLFAIFPQAPEKTGPVFWFMMQIAMLVGFATACPTNAFLIRAGIKERM